MPVYIHKRVVGKVETIKEFPNWKEAMKVCAAMQQEDDSAHYYVTRRCCKHWLTPQ